MRSCVLVASFCFAVASNSVSVPDYDALDGVSLLQLQAGRKYGRDAATESFIDDKFVEASTQEMEDIFNDGKNNGKNGRGKNGRGKNGRGKNNGKNGRGMGRGKGGGNVGGGGDDLQVGQAPEVAVDPAPTDISVDPVPGGEASAVGDPHMTTASGSKFDLGEHDLSFSQDGKNNGKNGRGKNGRGKNGRGKNNGKNGRGMGRGKGGGNGGGGDDLQVGQAPEVAVDPAPTDISVDPVPDGEASAVGDPHLTTATGSKFDLGETDLSLSQDLKFVDATTVDAPAQIGTDKRCAGKDLVRGKFDTVEACLAEFGARGDITTVAYYTQSCKNPKHRGICLGWSGECIQKGVHRTVNTALYDLSPPVEEEASAVGDPHLSTSSGSKSDLCCEGGKCHPCL